MIAKLMKLDRKMIILLGVIFAAAAIYIYLSFEGFAQNATYLEYMQKKYKTNRLCDPCYDPTCQTVYPVSQADCSNSGSTAAPKYNPFDFTSYSTTPASNGGSDTTTTTTSPPGITPSLYDQLKKEILALFPKRQPTSDILISFEPDGGSNVAPKPTFAGAPKDQVVAGTSGKLQMDKMPAPALAPASAQANSPAISQGADYSDSCPYNMNDYIRKDSIPCYACNIR